MKILKRELLEDLYINKNLTSYEICKFFNCCPTTVIKNLRKYSIPVRRPVVRYNKIPTKEFLKQKYINEKLSTWKIEKEYGFCRGTVYRKLKEYGLTTRTLAESNIIYPRKNFEGDELERAYLIGFRIGDLRVRKMWKKSETISLDCGSTKPEQITLIKNLFENYGHVWISQPKAKVQIEVHLDMSFSFLLSKDIPYWVLSSKDYFFSFLAGFTDAEGSIYISYGRAIFSLGNYDYKLLVWFRENLILFGIECPKVYTDHTKGYLTKEGYFHNDNYSHLTISKKGSLLKLLTILKKYLRHENRVRQLNAGINNINQRNLLYGE